MGFSYTDDGTLQCFGCQATEERSHREGCLFLLQLDGPRSKKCRSLNSLYYETKRLETFIDWPIPWLSPRDLAADGFYYLRREDHCACIFCRGIVGTWEVGDVPREEHSKHFPLCPFIQGKPVGNVPWAQCAILEGLCQDGEEPPMVSPYNSSFMTVPAHRGSTFANRNSRT